MIDGCHDNCVLANKVQSQLHDIQILQTCTHTMPASLEATRGTLQRLLRMFSYSSIPRVSPRPGASLSWTLFTD
jgi:hypothetical protein